MKKKRKKNPTTIYNILIVLHLFKVPRRFFLIININLIDNLYEEIPNFVVEDQNEGSACTTDDIGERPLEESARPFKLADLHPAIQGVLVQHVGLCATALHHHTPAHGVEGVRDDPGHHGDALGDHPRHDEGRVLRVFQAPLGRVVQTEVGRPVDDDPLDGHAEPSVEPEQAVRFEDLG